MEMNRVLWLRLRTRRCGNSLLCSFSTIMKDSPRLDVRKSFGSFHSDDIETLIRVPDSEVHPPTIFEEIHEQTAVQFATSTERLPIGFGSDAKCRLFNISAEWTFINHGAFGGVLRPILVQANKWREYCESQPLRFYDRDLFPLTAHSLRRMAIDELHCPVEELLPLPNVTSGLNAIFNTLSLQLQPNDEIIYLSLTYGSTKKMIHDLCNRTHAQPIVVALSLPVGTDSEIVDTIVHHVTDKTKAIVLDAVTSNTAIALPVVDIAARCKSISSTIQVVVDAAHSLHSQDVAIYPKDSHQSGHSISSVVDFWLTNGHKWLSAPKGCALMWISPSVQHLRPTIVSHGFQAESLTQPFIARNKLLSSFAWDGCRDYAALLSMPSTAWLWKNLRFEADSDHPELNLQAIRRYVQSLLDYCESSCQERWKLEGCDFAAPKTSRSQSFMRLIPLPRLVLGIDTRQATDKEAFFLQVRF
jgi:selenocysteine lyase/cysteine desulfurase